MGSERSAGVIDTISLGYGLVNRRPWFIALPILLDLFFWIGPRLSIKPVMEGFFDLIASQGTADQALLDAMRRAAGEWDLLDLLALQTPTMMHGPDQAELVAGRPVITLDQPGVIALAAVVLIVAGLLLTIVYLTPLAQTVRSGQPDLPGFARQVWRAWLRLLALVGLLLAAMVAVTLPLSILTAILTLAGLNLLPLLVILLQIGVLWLLIYAYFAVDALLVSQVGPLQAIRYSVAVVHHNFWPALGLIVITLVVSLGLPKVFALVARVPIGVPIAIAANAYISTGLAAASMIFYRDRFARWQRQQRATMLSRVGPGPSR